MKKICIFFISFFVFINMVQAKFIAQSDTTIMQKVSETKHMKDDQNVVLKGHIIKQIGEETYLFSDDTGTIILDIDEDVWKGMDVVATDVVIIRGEYDKHLLKDSEIEVDTIELVSQTK